MRILIVEDDPVMMMLMTRMVEILGYDVISADDGLEAIGLVETECPDMVITDMMLPTLCGSEIISYVNNLAGKKIPVIMVSSMPICAFENDNETFGADAYLVKPVPLQLLKNTIAQLSDLRIYKEEACYISGKKAS